MEFDAIAEAKNNRFMTNIFYGYNHNPIIKDGELFDTKNMTTDFYPLLSPRNVRKKVASVAKDWVEKAIEIPAPVVHTQSSFTYYDYYVSLGASFGEDHKVDFEFKPGFEMNYVELYTQKKVRSTSGNESTEKYTLEKVFPSAGVSSISFNNTYTVDPDDIILHIYGHSNTDDNIESLKYFEQSGTIRGILIKNNTICYMINQKLFFGSQEYDFSQYIRGEDNGGTVKLLAYGAYILIFPLNLYFNTLTKECGSLGAWYEATNTTISYKLTDADGEAINATVSPTEPEEPANKDYWIDTSSETAGLYQYSKDLSMFVAIPTSYISITVPDPDFADHFEEGDAVFISNTSVEDIKNGSVIKKKGKTEDSSYIIVTGLITAAIEEEVDSCVFERKLPTLDYVCVSNNRVWGCHYGEENGVMVNEIYASKLGDAKNWYVYEGISTDSYALSLGDDGEFTGCIVYNGYPIFFKENVIYKMYGSYPAAYQLMTYDCRGCQKGSGESICIVGEYIMYKSNRDVCVFNGETPTAVSSYLGSEHFDNAVAGVSIDKYYISMRNKKTGEYSLFVYDLNKGLWMKEDDLSIGQFSSNKTGTLYGHDKNVIYAFIYDDEPLDAYEEYVDWSVITSEYNYDYPDRIYLSRITIRADIPFDADLTVEISYDDKPFQVAKTVRGIDDVTSHSIMISARRCDHYRLRISGHGNVKVYGITRLFNSGGETDGLENR